MGEIDTNAHQWGWSERNNLVLSPHLPALIRPTGELQFGADPRTARIVRLPRAEAATVSTNNHTTTAPPRAVLEALTNTSDQSLLASLQAHGISSTDAQDLIDELAAAGVLVHAAGTKPRRFTVLGAGGFAVHIASRLQAAGQQVQRRAIVRRTTDWLLSADPADVGVVIIAGQLWPDGKLQHVLHLRQLTHLPVGIRDGHAVLGPVVQPGKTACLTCLDTARTGADPQWPLLRLQLAGLPTPAAGPAVDMAIALVVAQCAPAAGQSPLLQRLTVEVSCDPVALSMQHTPVFRHALCPVCYEG